MEENVKLINAEDKKYYNKMYYVSIWTGAGYWTEQFKVYADYEEQALEIVVAYAEENAKGLLFDVDEIDEEEIENGLYIYIDATMNGATKPYYVLGENLVIKEIEKD